MTSAEIRQSFLDFFKSKGHTLVRSSSLRPDSPNLLFTNAGMNQFVPIFLGQRAPDVSRWAGAAPGLDTRAADTQKCIRAGGKHNDLEDVGLDTYHHTFFEMLGNWSFGDYFKQEAIAWAWELLTEVWKFPGNRLYATVYCPDKAKGEPSEFDQEAHDIWAEKFRAAGLDPAIHIVNGGKQDNFWMTGDTGPCGPCSELHIDLTPQGDTRGRLVNQATAECIEIWNLVFIQFNANPDGTFSPLPARHVDTGMGFERVAGIIQNTKNFTDFNRLISNYETDIFRPLFDKIEKLSGKAYGSTLPARDTHRLADKEKSDIAFRVIADHIRTLSFAIADGILPSNEGRGYVLRRILRRAVRYGRSLGFHEPFFYKLVDMLAETMGGVFPEIRAQRDHVEEVIQREEEAFNKTLDRGISLFEDGMRAHRTNLELNRKSQAPSGGTEVTQVPGIKMSSKTPFDLILWEKSRSGEVNAWITGQFAFVLYDTYGFPLDLTELMAREQGLTVDVLGFNKLMDEQRARARAAQKKEVIELSQVETTAATQFVGYDKLETPAKVLEVVRIKDKTAIILDTSP
ncbi:MAG: alanine--tRNA ligase, partial [Verrucomicrobiota bacterium]